MVTSDYTKEQFMKGKKLNINSEIKGSEKRKKIF